MGFIDNDKHNLTGNSLTLDDLVITWDDEEEIQLGTEPLDTKRQGDSSSVCLPSTQTEKHK